MGGSRDQASQERWQLSVCIDEVRAMIETLRSNSPTIANTRKLLESIAEVRHNIRRRLFWENYQKGTTDWIKLERCLEAIETYISGPSNVPQPQAKIAGAQPEAEICHLKWRQNRVHIVKITLSCNRKLKTEKLNLKYYEKIDFDKF